MSSRSSPTGRAARPPDPVKIAAKIMDRLRDLRGRLAELADRPNQSTADRQAIAEMRRMLATARRDSIGILGGAVGAMAGTVKANIADILATDEPVSTPPSKTSAKPGRQTTRKASR